MSFTDLAWDQAKSSFRSALLTWFKNAQRDLPWRRTCDAYAIWLSEIMLQQTRVATAIPYFERFLRRFPSLEALASAPEADLLAQWAGLGYYYRARNLQIAARQIVATGGAFPSTHLTISQLPGVGEYTSAAVASIAFGLPHAAVDGNVLRVLSRLLADGADIGSTTGKRHFLELAQELLDVDNPGVFNQAMMELGATVCVPKRPRCLVCPVNGFCRSRQEGTQAHFPVKLARQKSVNKVRQLLWIEEEGRILAWQRPPDARLMPGFWELPESEQLPAARAGRLLGSFRHGITVHNYTFELHEAGAPSGGGVCHWLSLQQLDKLPLSTVFVKAWRLLEKAAIRKTAVGAGQ